MSVIDENRISEIPEKITVLIVKKNTSASGVLNSDEHSTTQIIETGSGKEALKIVEEETVQVIIAEYKLPDMSGASLLSKAEDKLGFHKSVLITNYEDNEIIKESHHNINIHWYQGENIDNEKLVYLIRKSIKDYTSEKSLIRNEEKYRSAFNSMSDVFTRTDMNGICQLVSPSIYNLTGYTIEEIVGKNIEFLYTDPKQRKKIVDKLLKSDKVRNFEIKALRKDGKIITVSTNAKIFYKSNGEPAGIEGNIRDITKQKHAELEHEKLFNISFDLLSIAGIDGYFKELNPAWEKATGYTLEELYSKPFTEFIHPDDIEKTKSEIQKLSEGNLSFDFDNRYLTKSGEELYLSWTAIPSVEDGLLYCSARDVTTRKLAEKQSHEYQLRLKDLANQLTLAEEKVRKQIAVDLHDYVGQMLSSIRMQMSRITDMEDNPELVIRMKNISQALLKAIQATRAAIFDLSPPQLNELGLFAAVHDWMIEEIEHKYKIKIIMSGDENEYIGDENTRFLIFRSIRELGMNVVKHARATELDICFKKTDEFLEITIQDDGIGFNYNPDLLRLKSNVYGLFSIQERISDLGGSMEVNSIIDKGTTIKLLVPIEDGKRDMKMVTPKESI
jgi:PAS domain S-box-containing protein